MEDTGIPLFAHGIPTPTHKSSILQCTGRREGQKAGRAIGADKTAAHRFGLSRIIESPSTKEKKNEHNGRRFQILAKNYETFLSSKSTINIHISNT